MVQSPSQQVPESDLRQVAEGRSLYLAALAGQRLVGVVSQDYLAVLPQRETVRAGEPRSSPELLRAVDLGVMSPLPVGLPIQLEPAERYLLLEAQGGLPAARAVLPKCWGVVRLQALALMVARRLYKRAREEKRVQEVPPRYAVAMEERQALVVW